MELQATAKQHSLLLSDRDKAGSESIMQAPKLLIDRSKLAVHQGIKNNHVNEMTESKMSKNPGKVLLMAQTVLISLFISGKIPEVRS